MFDEFLFPIRFFHTVLIFRKPDLSGGFKVYAYFNILLTNRVVRYKLTTRLTDKS